MSNNHQNVEIELELTFLAKYLPREIQQVTPIKLLDVYIPKSLETHSELRLRQKGDKYEITKKIPLNDFDASAHQEFTIPIKKLEFDEMIPISQKRVEKDRYNVQINGYSAEVDVFKGLLKGLVMIDFEFETELEKTKFITPECCLVDVTQEDFLAGGVLAGHAYKDIQKELEKLNYQPIYN